MGNMVSGTFYVNRCAGDGQWAIILHTMEGLYGPSRRKSNLKADIDRSRSLSEIIGAGNDRPIGLSITAQPNQCKLQIPTVTAAHCQYSRYWHIASGRVTNKSRNMAQQSSCTCALASWRIRSEYEVIPRNDVSFAPAA